MESEDYGGSPKAGNVYDTPKDGSVGIWEANKSVDQFNELERSPRHFKILKPKDDIFTHRVQQDEAKQ